MKTEDYLQKVLERESLSEKSAEIKALQDEKKEVDKLLKDGFKESNPKIRYAGSYKKDTMIRDSFDLDISCYFKHEEDEAGETLEEIYNNVRKTLETKYIVTPKTSALRLENKNADKYGVYFHIDVVPGRFVDDKEQDTYLYQKDGDKDRLQTNLDKHIDHIKNSGLTDVIKLVKYWRTRKGLQIRTFVLELLVVEVLRKNPPDTLEGRLKKFWKTLTEEIEEIKIEDPANPTGNDLSRFFDTIVKSTLSSHASIEISNIGNGNWENIFGKIEEMSEAQKVSSIKTFSASIPQAAKPWSF